MSFALIRQMRRRRGGGAGVTPVAGATAIYAPTGAAVDGWTNSGSLGATANLAALGTNATLTTLDGKTVVDFSGASAGFGMTAGTEMSGGSGVGHTICAVARTPASIGATNRLISGGVGAASAGASIIQVVSASGNWQIQTTNTGVSPAAATWYALCVTWDASTGDERLFIGADWSTAAATVGAGANTVDGITIGSHSTGVVDWLGRVADVRVYSFQLSSAQRTQMKSFYTQEYPSAA